MTRNGSLAFLAWLLVLAALGTLFVPGCSTSGQTGDCPNLTLYNINAAGQRNSELVQSEREASVAAGCMTPLGDASVGGSP